MAALETPNAQIGWKAKQFLLKGVDGKMHTLESSAGKNGLLVVFMCNHCPYVQKQIDRLIREATELKQYGVNTVAIMPNDTDAYPDDAFDKMQALAREKNFPFPYLLDETQEVAASYGAVCTPDIFGFNGKLELQYRGRLDESWALMKKDPQRELFEAMLEVAQTGKTTRTQYPSIGCSIKWRGGEPKRMAQ